MSPEILKRDHFKRNFIFQPWDMLVFGGVDLINPPFHSLLVPCPLARPVEKSSPASIDQELMR